MGTVNKMSILSQLFHYENFFEIWNCSGHRFDPLILAVLRGERAELVSFEDPAKSTGLTSLY
jgi:hypothetical protein